MMFTPFQISRSLMARALNKIILPRFITFLKKNRQKLVFLTVVLYVDDADFVNFSQV